MSVAPQALSENTGLAFVGEQRWAPARLTPGQAEKLAAARNPTGRPNDDVLRCFVGKTGRRVREHRQIDFPSHYTAQEAALHERPFALLQKRIPNPTGAWWVNPHAQPPLRLALARLDRFLASAPDPGALAWTWFESDRLPDDSLLVVARDDDFTHAVLQSTAFATWWQTHAPSGSPAQTIESFPFPWPPSTPLGALTRIQQDLRSVVARAALAGDVGQIDSAVAAAFGWPAELAPAEMLAALDQLHARRLAVRPRTGSD